MTPGNGFEPEHYEDFYVQLRGKIRKWLESEEGKSHQWSEYLMLAPDLFHLLIKLMLDPDVPTGEKAKILAVLIYFVSPIDILPEIVLGPAGFLDDIALAAFAIHSLLTKVDPEVIRRNWAGQGSDHSTTLREKILELRGVKCSKR